MGSIRKQVPRALMVLVSIFVLTMGVALAQGGEAASSEDVDLVTAGLQAIGLMLNAGGVWFLVQVVRKYLPKIRKTNPQILPLLALVAGPALNFVGTYLASILLVTINFQPLIDAIGNPSFSLELGLLAGAGAVTGDQVAKQRERAAKLRRAA